MKEAIVSKGPTVTIQDSPIPKPKAGQVVIKVVVSGSNPKDWKYPNRLGAVRNEGDDIAGTVHEVGAGVYEFQPGDRVMAFHQLMTPHGSYAEYAVAWAHTTAKIADKTPFEEAAAVPLAALTAAVGLYAHLRLPAPWNPTTDETPFVVWGGSTSVGSSVLQLAKQAGIHPLIAVGGRAKAHVESLLDASKGDTFVDYRDGEEAVIENIRKALGGRKLRYAFDAVSENNSYVTLGKVLEPDGALNVVLQSAQLDMLPETMRKLATKVTAVHADFKDLGFVSLRQVARGLEEGWFRGQPQEIVPGGLAGIEGALHNLMNGKASGSKYVFRIAETPGLGQ